MRLQADASRRGYAHQAGKRVSRPRARVRACVLRAGCVCLCVCARACVCYALMPVRACVHACVRAGWGRVLERGARPPSPEQPLSTRKHTHPPTQAYRSMEEFMERDDELRAPLPLAKRRRSRLTGEAVDEKLADHRPLFCNTGERCRMRVFV